MRETKLVTAPRTIKGINDAARTVEHVITARVVDSEGDVVIPRGGRFDNYLKNPVVFFNHKSVTDPPIGKCLALDVSDDEIVATTKFAGDDQAHPQAETVWRLYRDGFLRAFSIGFAIEGIGSERLPGQRGRTISKWELFEYSAVGVPANPAALLRAAKAYELAPGATERDLHDAIVGGGGRKYWTVAAEHIFKTQEEHVPKNSNEMNLTETLDVLATKLAPMIAERIQGGDSHPVIRDMRGNVMALGGGEWKNPLLGGGAPAIIHSRGEAPYSFVKALRSLVMNDPRLAPYERAVSEKMAEIGYQVSAGNSMVVPLSSDMWQTPGHEPAAEALGIELKQSFAPTAKAMDAVDDTAGGSLVALPAQGELLEVLRPQLVSTAIGAQQISLPPQGAMHWPRGMSDPDFEWLPPNATISDSQPTTAPMTMAAKRAGGLVKIPNDLLRYSPQAEPMVRRGLGEGLARIEDVALLEGQGGSIQPLGLLRYPRSADDTPTADMVTLHNAGTTGNDGDTFEGEDPLTMIALVEEAPDAQGPTAFIMRPTMFAALANRRVDSGGGPGTGPFLFQTSRGDLTLGVRKQLSGYPVQ